MVNFCFLTKEAVFVKKITISLSEYSGYFETSRNGILSWRPDVCVGGGQILERRNVERPIFRNLKIPNIKITKDELFDSFIFEFNLSYFRIPLNTQNI